MGRLAGDDQVKKAALPHALRVFVGVTWGMWILSLVQALVTFAWTHSAHASFQALAMDNPFFDFICYTGRMKFLHTPEFFTYPDFPWNYPAPCIFVYRFFYALSPHWHTGWVGFAAFLSCVCALLFVVMRRFSHALAARGLEARAARNYIAAVFVSAWPIYFAFERGNIELMLWMLIAAGISSYLRGKWWLAAVLLGAAAAFKLYPVLLFGLFLPPKRFKELAAGLVTMGLITLVALRFLEPSIPFAFHQTQAGVHHFVTMYTLTYDPLAIGYDHSLFSLVKLAEIHHQGAYPTSMNRYTLVMGMLMVTLFFVRLRRMPRTNQVLALVVAIVMLPPTSFDYTLQSLYIPWACLALVAVSAARRGVQVRGLLSAMVCLGVLLAPETFLQWHFVLFAGQLKAIALIGLTVIAATYPFAETEMPAIAS